MKKPRNIPDRVVLEKSVDGLIYCLIQLFSYFHWDKRIKKVFKTYCKTKTNTRSAQIVENVAIEGTLLFMRKVQEFFQPKPKNEEKDDDLRAYDFAGYTGSAWIFNEDDRTSLNKYVAHMTTRGVTHGKVNWRIIEGVDKICEHAFPFLDFLITDFFKDNPQKAEEIVKKKALLTEYRKLNREWLKTHKC